VAAARQRIGYYAGMPYVPLAGVATEALGPYLARAGARYAVLDEGAQVEALRRSGAIGVRSLHHEVASGREAWVLELGTGPEAAQAAGPAHAER
jgi:hypothetical protein